MTLKFYRSVTKGLNIKVTKFRGLVPKFLEVTGEKLVGGGPFWPLLILNRVKSTRHFKRGLFISAAGMAFSHKVFAKCFA